MKLLWHLIRKDLLALRLWLLAWLAALATHFALRAIQLTHGEAALPERFATSHRPDYLALLLLVALIVPQALQLDPPARAGAFWKMLPLSRWRVLLAKLAFIGGCFIVLPAIFEAAYFSMAGFGSWTWSAVGVWFWNTAPLVLIVAGAGALAGDLRIAALLIGAAVLALLPGGLGTFRAFFAQHVAFADALGQQPVLAITRLGWQLVVASLVIVPWQYLARGRFGCLVAGAVFGVAWMLGVGVPAGSVAPQAPTARKIEGVQVEVDPLNINIRTMTRRHGQVSDIISRVRITGIPAGMEIEKVTMPEGHLIRDHRTIDPVPENELKDMGVEEATGTEGRMQDWFRNRAPLDPGAPMEVPSPHFAMTYQELAQAPAALEGRIRVQLKRVRTVSEQPLQPGTYWHDGLHQAGIISVGHDEGATLSIRQRLESGLVDPTGKSLNPPAAEPLRVRLHQVPLNLWLDLATLSPGTGAFQFGGAFSVPGESLRVQSQQDRTRSQREEFADYRLDFNELPANDWLPPLVRARFLEGASDPGTWRLAVEETETFVVEMPIRLEAVMPEQSSWHLSKDEGGPLAALGKDLQALTLREPNNPQAVDDYLHALFDLIGRGHADDDLRHYDNTILLKLAAVAPDHLDALCRWGQLASAPHMPRPRDYISSTNEWHQRVPEADYRCSQFRRVVVDRAEWRHKDWIMRYHSPRFDLLEAILEHGWIDEALPRMCALAQNEPVPESWTQLFADHPGPATDAAILAQSRLGAIPTQQLAMMAARPGAGLQPAIAATWHAATEGTAQPLSLLHIFALACKSGVPEIPGDLRVIIDAARPPWIREDEFGLARRTLLDVLAMHSDCPTDPTFARPWLAENAARLHFNPNTQRYELR